MDKKQNGTCDIWKAITVISSNQKELEQKVPPIMSQQKKTQ